MAARPGRDRREIGLDLSAFEADRQGAWCRAFLDRDHAEIDRLNIDHIPVFLAGDQRADAMSKQELRAVIERALAAAR